VSERATVGMLALSAAWETSGAVEGALGIALHLSAVTTFGLGSQSVERLHSDATPDALRRGEELHGRHPDALRAYLDRQYEETQAFLNGDTVVVFRGTSALPEHAGTVPLILRPLSSFALERSVAVAFPTYGDIPSAEHHALIIAAVPAARVLSTPVTGMASLLEGEVVVLGAQRPGDTAEQLVAPAGARVG
jgi:hypothetical protein